MSGYEVVNVRVIAASREAVFDKDDGEGMRGMIRGFNEENLERMEGFVARHTL